MNLLKTFTISLWFIIIWLLKICYPFIVLNRVKWLHEEQTIYNRVKFVNLIFVSHWLNEPQLTRRDVSLLLPNDWILCLCKSHNCLGHLHKWANWKFQTKTNIFILLSPGLPFSKLTDVSENHQFKSKDFLNNSLKLRKICHFVIRNLDKKSPDHHQ